MTERKELILYLGSEELKKKLGLPKDSVIINIFEQIVPDDLRRFGFRYSTTETQK